MDSKFKRDLDWEEKAKINPLYAIMSDPAFSEENTSLDEKKLASFYGKGERIWKIFFESELLAFIDPPSTKVLEFGCGMGRLLKNAGSRGYNCYGIDISETQLKLAQQFLGGANYHFYQVTDNRIPFDDNYFDFVYSYAVLQHIRKLSDFKASVSEMCRVVKKGGTIKVQLPTIEGTRFADNKRKFFYSVPHEERALVFYWMRTFKFIPMVRTVRYDHWGGAAYYVRVEQFLSILKVNNIHVELISFSPEGFIIVTGIKKGY